MKFRFPTRFGRKSAALICGLAAGCSGGAATQDWQSLIANNPFGGPPAAVAASANDLEFRGVVQEDGAYIVNLYDPATKTSQWLPVKGTAPGLTVNDYDEKAGKVAITHGGKQLNLSIKQPTVALMAAATPTPALGGVQGPGAAPTPGVRPNGREGGPQFNRTLPPETQAMIEEIRRRRAQRQQSIQQTGSPANAMPVNTQNAITLPARNLGPQPARPNSP